MPNAFDPDNDEGTPGSGSHAADAQQKSLFSGTSNLSLFGGLNQLDNYFGGEECRPQKQSLFGGSTFYDQSAGHQDLHSFNPQQHQEEESDQQMSM